MNNKYLKILLNIIAIVICLFIGYGISVFSIFFFWGRHADKEIKNELIITIGICIVFLIIISIIGYCIYNIWKVLRNR